MLDLLQAIIGAIFEASCASGRLFRPLYRMLEKRRGRWNRNTEAVVGCLLMLVLFGVGLWLTVMAIQILLTVFGK